MNKTLKLISVIIFYLASGFVFYVITCEHNILFFLYKFVYGGLFFIILYLAYKYFAQKYK